MLVPRRHELGYCHPLRPDLRKNGDETCSAKSADLPGDAASMGLVFPTAQASVGGMLP